MVRGGDDRVDSPAAAAGHPSDRELALFLEQGLEPGELLAVDEHLASCASCRSRLEAGWDDGPAREAWTELVAGPRSGTGVEVASPSAPPEHRLTRPPRSARTAWLVAAAVLAALGSAILLRELSLSRRQAALGRLLREAEAAIARLEPAVAQLTDENQRLREQLRDLASGQRLTGAAPPEAAPPTDPRAPASRVVLSDQGREIGLAPPSRLSGLPALPAGLREAVVHALAEGRLPRPMEVWDLLGSRSVLRSGEDAEGSGSGPALLSPVATAVENDRPSFRFRRLAGTDPHRVRVYGRRYREVADSGAVEGGEWRPSQPLPRDEVLSWQVVAGRGAEEVVAPAPPEPEARFRILSEAELAALQEKERLAGPSHLARAVLFAEAGLLDEAETEVLALERENPGSPTVRSLLESLREGR